MHTATTSCLGVRVHGKEEQSINSYTSSGRRWGFALYACRNDKFSPHCTASPLSPRIMSATLEATAAKHVLCLALLFLAFNSIQQYTLHGTIHNCCCSAANDTMVTNVLTDNDLVLICLLCGCHNLFYISTYIDSDHTMPRSMQL